MKVKTMPSGLVSIAMLGAVVAVVCAISGCAQAPARDSGGLTESEALTLPMEAQYALAEERYVAFNDRVAEMQLLFSSDEWVLGTSTYQVIPDGGKSEAENLPGATNSNSYIFLAFRDFETTENIVPRLEELEKKWAEIGLENLSVVFEDGRKLYRAVAADGFWIEMVPRPGKVLLTAYSPVYWGDNLRLVVGIGDRREAEDAIGEVWAPVMRDDDTSLHFPGDYRPFPKWDAIPEGSEDYSIVKEE